MQYKQGLEPDSYDAAFEEIYPLGVGTPRLLLITFGTAEGGCRRWGIKRGWRDEGR